MYYAAIKLVLIYMRLYRKNDRLRETKQVTECLCEMQRCLGNKNTYADEGIWKDIHQNFFFFGSTGV
jgi:hypothetical protein